MPLWQRRQLWMRRRLFSRSSKVRLEVDPLPGRWCQICLAMIEPVGRCEWGWGLRTANAHLDGVDAAILLRRRKRKAVFVADELRDLGVCGIEFLFGRREVGAATCGFSHALQQLICPFELQRRLCRICGTRFLFSTRLRILQAAHKRNGQEADVADL